MDTPLKRKRVDNEKDKEQLSSSAPAITRSPTFWCEDGNIILQVENTQFRVHRSMLSRHSGFFRDMFRLPQPTGEHLVEGCSVVFMQGDKSSEWANLLALMYNSLLEHRAPVDYPMDLLMAMLRLGHKYQINHFRDTAANCLRDNLPMSLDDWMNSCYSDPFNGLSSDSTTLAGYEFDLVNLALEIGFQTILPVTYFLCLRDQWIETVFSGIERTDGSISHLSRETQQLLVLAHPKICSAMLKHPLKSLRGDKFIPVSTCKTENSCILARLRLFELASPAFHTIDYALLHIRPIQSIVKETLCPDCTEAYYREFATGRRELWNQIPSFFRLPRWNELKDFE